jgi:c-di-GMP-binding flagellar brake protein YcgR
MRRERRVNARYPVAWELRGKSLRAIEPGSDDQFRSSRDLHGRVADISAGGLCLLTDDEADLAGPVRGEIVVPQLSVGIPTLLQVRWTQRDPGSQTYRVGLQFLV